ncbi:GNAT family N-acetyltransferase [Pseudoneobacillus sp. C159]
MEKISKLTIQNYQPSLLDGLKKLYRAVMSKDPNAVFWWPGEQEFTWKYCFCVLDGEEFIGKGQVQPINVQKPGESSHSAKHAIYLNIKLHPDFEDNHEVFTMLYDALLEKAMEIKSQLPAEFDTLLCVGNASTEAANNSLFATKGFTPLNFLYGMERDLTGAVTEVEPSIEGLSIQFWKMESPEEEQRYLQLESMIWPEHALSPNRLKEYKSKEGWTAITAVVQGEMIGSVMCWEESEANKKYGEIEDLFVLPEWRQKGIAQALLTKALSTLKERGLERAELMVLTDNVNALSLYQNAGFTSIYTENRYCLEL